MGLNENEQVTVEQLLTGMAVSSGNDASAAMAKYVGGSVPAFINMMNAKARALGMRDNYFVNPHDATKGQYTTARDMLTLPAPICAPTPMPCAFITPMCSTIGAG